MLTVAPASADQDPGAVLRTRLTGFAGFLRANGYGVGGGESIRLLEAAERVGIFDGEILRWSLKALLCGRGEEWRRFDPLFDAYFLPPNTRSFVEYHAATTGEPESSGAAGNADRQMPVGAAHNGASTRDDDRAARHGASREESLSSTDFRDIDRADQVRDIEALMRRFARRLKHLYLRREARFDQGRRLDMQGTIRRSVGSGGTPFRLAWKDRRRVRPRFVLLLDVSRSMSQYSFFYLRLARALCAELADVHCFIFHTRIADVVEALRDRDPWRSQERLHLLAEGWGGGTRIGECLQDFNRRYAPRLVHSRTAVIIASDGYDTGEPETLATALGSVGRRARRIVWLNPLLRQPDFRPLGRAMQAALPHLDLFVPGADLAELEHILPELIEALR
jgi:uncharacterized protein with von Willebrand factor type A (vWA) domain